MNYILGQFLFWTYIRFMDMKTKG